MYFIVVRFVIFIFVLVVLSISCYLRFLIYSQSEMKGGFIFVSFTNTGWSCVACNIVFYVIRIKNEVSASIPDQGSSSSKYLLCKSKVRKRFGMTWWICSYIDYSRVFAVVAHLAVISCSFLIVSYLNIWPMNFFPQSYTIIVGLDYVHNHAWYNRFAIVYSCLSFYCAILNHLVVVCNIFKYILVLGVNPGIIF